MHYIIPYIVWLLALIGVFQGGVFTFLGMAVTFVLHPLLDFIFAKVQIPALHGRQKSISEILFYFSFLALLILFVVFLFRTQVFLEKQDYISLAGTILSVGVVFGFLGINTAHEFIHRNSLLQRALGVLQLMMVSFAQYRINHIDIHHKWVATPLDTSTAKKGEIVYTYWYRSYVVGWWKTYLYEVDRVQGSLLQNRMHHYLLVTLLFSVFLLIYGGMGLLLSWWLMGVVAKLLLLTVDYMEHYGLERKEIKPGIYEAIKPRHSWDSYSYFTNTVLFNLGIHSHHHTRSQLHFTDLRAEEGIRGGASVFPYGYSVMFIIALIPPWWRRVVG